MVPRSKEKVKFPKGNMSKGQMARAGKKRSVLHTHLTAGTFIVEKGEPIQGFVGRLLDRHPEPPPQPHDFLFKKRKTKGDSGRVKVLPDEKPEDNAEKPCLSPDLPSDGQKLDPETPA